MAETYRHQANSGLFGAQSDLLQNLKGAISSKTSKTYAGMAASGKVRNFKHESNSKDQGSKSSAFFNRTSPSPDLMAKVASLLKEKTADASNATLERWRSSPSLPSSRSTPEETLKRSSSSAAKGSQSNPAEAIDINLNAFPGLSRRRFSLTPEHSRNIAKQHRSDSSARLAGFSERRRYTDDTESSIPDSAPAWSEELLNWMLADKAELLLEVQRAQRRQHELQQEVDRARVQRVSAADEELERLKVERRLLLEKLHHLSQQDVEAAALLERMQMENDALTNELERSQEVCKEMLAARRAARDALSEMSAQNARLVSAYVDKKQEASQLKEELRQHQRDAEARIQSLEAELRATQAQWISLKDHLMRSGGLRFDEHAPYGPPSSPIHHQSDVLGAAATQMPDARMENDAEQTGFCSPFSTPNRFTSFQAHPHHEDKENSSLSGNVDRATSARKKWDTENNVQEDNVQPSSEPTPATTHRGKGEWNKERSELLSLLERLQHQLSAHAEQQATPGRFKPEQGSFSPAEMGHSDHQQQHSPFETQPTTCPKEGGSPCRAKDSPNNQNSSNFSEERVSPPPAADTQPAMTPPSRRSSASSGPTPRRSHFSIPRQSYSEPPSRNEVLQASPSSNSSSQTAASQERRSSGVNLSKAFEGARYADTSSRLSTASDESEAGDYDAFPSFPDPRPTSTASIHLSPRSTASPRPFSTDLPSSPEPARFSEAHHSPVIAPMKTPFASKQHDGPNAAGTSSKLSPHDEFGSKMDEIYALATPPTDGQQGSPAALQEKQRLANVEKRNADLEEEVQRLRQLQEKAEEHARQAELRKNIEHHKQAGNTAFQQQQYEKAVQEYTSGLEISAPGTDGACAVLLCNRAAAFHGMGRYLDAVADCYKAEQKDPSYARLYHRRADAYCALGVYDAAAEDLSKLAQFGCGREVQARLQEVQHKLKAQFPVNHYAVLGVKSTATAAEIKSAYRSLALKYHPDKAQHQIPKEASHAIFKLVTAANAALSDAEKRRAHDLLVLRHKYRRFYSYHF